MGASTQAAIRVQVLPMDSCFSPPGQVPQDPITESSWHGSIAVEYPLQTSPARPEAAPDVYTG